jgi:alpha-tubulin suppressor-like RCC1 family protein
MLFRSDIDSIRDRIVLAIIITFIWNNQILAFAGNTHRAITHEAVNNSILAEDYLNKQIGFTNGLETQLDLSEYFRNDITERVVDEPKFHWDRTNISVLEWLMEGSMLEDVPNPRARHHFYDPIRNTGLNNSEHPAALINLIKFFSKKKYTDYWPFDATGALSFDRATGNAGIWENEYTNYYHWDFARILFYEALRTQNKTEREKRLGSLFFILGHICHFLEDQGVPAHTRNDFIWGHMVGGFYDEDTRLKDGGNPFEIWVESQVTGEGNTIPSSWLDGVGSSIPAFSSLKKYWDTDMYSGSYIGSTTPDNWGLCERTNYQFLSFSTMFRNDGSLYAYPNPSKINAPVYSEVVNEKKHYYRSGYDVPHLAKVTYSTYTSQSLGYTTTYEENALEEDIVSNDYAQRTVPRTINYTAGLLNYFFRGRLSIEPNCLDCETVTFVIRNDSNNSGVPQTLKGGTFELFWDDRDGNRTKINDFTIPGWTSSSTLNYDQQVTGTFSRPDSNEIETYTVVYTGQISENPAQPDEDDANAIAVATLVMGYPIIAWGSDADGIVSNIPEGNDFTDVAAGKYHALAIRSNGSLVAWGWNDDGQCNVPEGNDFIALTGGTRHSIALKSDGSLAGWGDNSIGQIDVPAGNDFVAIAAGDYHNLAITTDGLIVGWGGWNDFGECDAPEPNVGTIYVAVSAGRYHSLALQSDGRIRAWGDNQNGQTRIYQAAGYDHEAVAASWDYNFLLLLDDELISWGGGDWFEPGLPDYHYRPPDENDFVAIAAGTVHIAALTSDGRIFCWGYDNFNYAPAPMNPVPEGIVFTKNLAAGYEFTVALKAR